MPPTISSTVIGDQYLHSRNRAGRNRLAWAGTVGFCGGGPASSCPFTPSNIATTAIHIRLHGAMIGGTPVNGDIDIGQTAAE
jgi:hypothetical protein